MSALVGLAGKPWAIFSKSLPVAHTLVPKEPRIPPATWRFIAAT